MEKNFEFRTETYLGLGERDAIRVMTHETWEQENTDIPETLLEQPGLIQDEGIKADLRSICEDGFAEDEDGEEYVSEVYRKVLAEIKRTIGKDIKYVLWLAPYNTVAEPDPNKGGYGQYIKSPADIDKYEVGDVLLSDMGDAGHLWGYEQCPHPVDEGETADTQEPVNPLIKAFADAQWNLIHGDMSLVGFDYHGTFIVNPWMDETGRFELSDKEAAERYGSSFSEFCSAAEKYMGENNLLSEESIEEWLNINSEKE